MIVWALNPGFLFDVSSQMIISQQREVVAKMGLGQQQLDEGTDGEKPNNKAGKRKRLRFLSLPCPNGIATGASASEKQSWQHQIQPIWLSSGSPRYGTKNPLRRSFATPKGSSPWTLRCCLQSQMCSKASLPGRWTPSKSVRQTLAGQFGVDRSSSS